tara:strand:- start:1019 stop:2173 length:1155 start_codon:yes stop_codon:yes gene_type:complete
MNKIPLCVPYLTGLEKQYVNDSIKSGWVSSVGPQVDQFETDFSKFIGSTKSVALSSGTAAIHLSLILSGIKESDEVIVPSLTFIAPVNCIKYVGANPIFIDVDYATGQIDIDILKKFIQQNTKYKNNKLVNKITGNVIKAILPVHILGYSANIDEIIAIAKRFDLKVIEDATESLGTKFKDKSVGTYGDFGCFSFNGNKLITTGSGGMLVSNSLKDIEKAKHLSTQAKSHPVEYIHDNTGYNYRLSNISAAFGIAQLENINNFIDKKNEIHAHYSKNLEIIDGIEFFEKNTISNCVVWLNTIKIDSKKYGINSRELMKILNDNNIETRPLWQPLHKSTIYSDYYYYGSDNSEKLFLNCLSIPSSVGLSLEQQNKVIKAIKKNAK